MLQQLNVVGDSCKQIHTCVKQKGEYILSTSYDISIQLWIFLLTFVKQLIIIDYQSLNYAVK